MDTGRAGQGFEDGHNCRCPACKCKRIMERLAEVFDNIDAMWDVIRRVEAEQERRVGDVPPGTE